jgi:hypothetical protein
MPDQYLDSEFINSSFIVYGDEYGFSRKFTSWHECQWNHDPTPAWDSPGVLLRQGDAQSLQGSFLIANDWNGPATIWIELVLVNQSKTTGNMRIGTNGSAALHAAPDTWVNLYNHAQITDITLTGETNQRVCIPHLRKFTAGTQDGIMSGNVHFWIWFDLASAGTTYTGDIWLSGFNVYTFGGR